MRGRSLDLLEILTTVALVLLALATLLLLPACGLFPGPPTPTPTPPPQCPPTCPEGQECLDPENGCQPKPVKYAELAISACPDDPTEFCQGGKPMDFAGCIVCCLGWEGGWDAWPMFSPELAAYLRDKGDCKRLHARPGPFLAADEYWLGAQGARMPLRWKAEGIGGPYIEVNGKADLTRFNPAFWSYNERAQDDIGAHGMTSEIDVDDGWREKNGCPYSPWNAARNVQGEDHCGLRVGEPRKDAWIRQVVLTYWRFGNKTWQIGNESRGAGTKEQTIAWERWVASRIRFWEDQFGSVHSLIATNSGVAELESDPNIDYVNRHDLVTKPIADKPTSINEINPAPANYVSAYCGTEHLWAWRAELPLAQWEAALAGIREARQKGCPSACPKPLAPGASVYLNNKPYGHGFDSTVRVKGDPEFCRLIHGTPENDCHLEGWPQRTACEMELMGGCPIWQCRTSSHPDPLRCLQPQHPVCSCDHWGTAGGAQDDPHTPEYEGQPAECGDQRVDGSPAAGFYTVARGKGDVRACKPDGTGCGPWRIFDRAVP